MNAGRAPRPAPPLAGVERCGRGPRASHLSNHLCTCPGVKPRITQTTEMKRTFWGDMPLKHVTTFNNGSLGSRIDEERSEMR